MRPASVSPGSVHAQIEQLKMKRPSCHEGLDDRCRDLNGEIRPRSSSMRVDSLREI